MATASTVTAALAQKLPAVFACKGSDYSGSGRVGGGMVVVDVMLVAGNDSCSEATVLPIESPFPSACIFRLEQISQARGDSVTGGSSGSAGGGGSVGKGSRSLARAVVHVVMGAIGKVSPTQNVFIGASFSSRCHHTTLHGNTFFADPNMNAQSLHLEQQPLQTRPPDAMNANQNLNINRRQAFFYHRDSPE